MNKLLMNERKRNHIRFLFAGELPEWLPEDEGDRIRWAESEFERLRQDPSARRLSLFSNKRKGYLVSVWTLGGKTYVIQCLRTISGETYVSTIYLGLTESDALAVAKFLRENADTIMRDYKRQILDARDALLNDATTPRA